MFIKTEDEPIDEEAVDAAALTAGLVFAAW